MSTKKYTLGHDGDNRYTFIVSDDPNGKQVYLERYFNKEPLRIGFSYQNDDGEWFTVNVFDYHDIESARIYWKYLKSIGFTEMSSS